MCVMCLPLPDNIPAIIDPFYWAWLPMAKVPFSDDIVTLVLDKLKSNEFVQSLVNELRAVFKVIIIITDYRFSYSSVW